MRRIYLWVVPIILAVDIQAQQDSVESLAKAASSQQPILKIEATIRGSREQPKVMSIVPWQPPTEKQPLPSPVLSRINQQFQPLNRDEFRRKIDYFKKLSNK